MILLPLIIDVVQIMMSRRPVVHFTARQQLARIIKKPRINTEHATDLLPALR